MAGATPIRHIRVPDDRWAAAQARAARDGESLAQVVNRFLEDYAGGAEGPTLVDVRLVRARLGELLDTL
jgi:hypothetical protein